MKSRFIATAVVLTLLPTLPARGDENARGSFRTHHNIGRVIQDGRSFGLLDPLFLSVVGASGAKPRFVMLHIDSITARPDCKITIDLGYGTDVLSAESGPDVWTRPIDLSRSVGPIWLLSPSWGCSARLREFALGEPSESHNRPPGTALGSWTNPDPFLVTDPYVEPIYETRLQCTPGFAFQDAACDFPAASEISNAVRARVTSATGFLLTVKPNEQSEPALTSCTGTLIADDLFLTARHCLSGFQPTSASVTFDYATLCGPLGSGGRKPRAHRTRFHRVVEVSPWVSGDWAVLRLDAPPGALPTPLAIRADEPIYGEPVFTVHHPNGASKKAQHGRYESVREQGTWYEYGFDFASGSSGSAMFDAQGRLLTGPLSSGPPSGSNDPCRVDYDSPAPARSALLFPRLGATLVSDRDPSLGMVASEGGEVVLQPNLLNANAQRFFVYKHGMLQVAADPALALSTADGAFHGAQLYAVKGCTPAKPSCTWTFQDGMLRSDEDPRLTVNAYGGAVEGTRLVVVDDCSSTNPDCTWTYRNFTLQSDTNHALTVKTRPRIADPRRIAFLSQQCGLGDRECTWTYHRGRLNYDAIPEYSINAYGGAAHGIIPYLVRDCPLNNTDCRWTFSHGMVVSDTNRSLVLNAYGGARESTELRLVNDCSISNGDCTWTASPTGGRLKVSVEPGWTVAQRPTTLTVQVSDPFSDRSIAGAEIILNDRSVGAAGKAFTATFAATYIPEECHWVPPECETPGHCGKPHRECTAEEWIVEPFTLKARAPGYVDTPVPFEVTAP